MHLANETFQSTQHATFSALVRTPPLWPSPLLVVWIPPVVAPSLIPKPTPPPLSMGIPMDVNAIRRPKPLPP